MLIPDLKPLEEAMDREAETGSNLEKSCSYGFLAFGMLFSESKLIRDVPIICIKICMALKMSDVWFERCNIRLSEVNLKWHHGGKPC